LINLILNLFEPRLRFKRKQIWKNTNKEHTIFGHGVRSIVPTSPTAERLHCNTFLLSLKSLGFKSTTCHYILRSSDPIYNITPKPYCPFISKPWGMSHIEHNWIDFVKFDLKCSDLSSNVLMSANNQSLHKNSKRVREEAYRELEKKAPGSFCLEQSRQGHCIWHGCFTILHPSCCGPASSKPLKVNKSLAAIN